MPNEEKKKGKATDTYYHYTNEAGAKGIAKSGVINKSTQVRGDAVFGDGAYVTKLTPDTPKSKIVENNYDNRTNKAWVEDVVKSGAVDYFVEMQLPKDAVKQCKTPDGRDVHRVPDRDIKLDRETKPRIDKTPGAAKK